MTVFSRAGYALDGGPGGDWRILWSHKYPFKTLSPSLGASLRPHQRINHYPGTGCFVSKPSLASLPFSYIPKAFRLPQQAQQLREEVNVEFLMHSKDELEQIFMISGLHL